MTNQEIRSKCYLLGTAVYWILLFTIPLLNGADWVIIALLAFPTYCVFLLVSTVLMEVIEYLDRDFY